MEPMTAEIAVMGDIGEPIRHIELEPVEVPVVVPEREKVPA